VQEEPPAAAGESPASEAERDVHFVPNPWFTLTSQWRLGALVAFLMLGLIGVNWAIVTLFHSSLGRSVEFDGKVDKKPAAAPARPASRGNISAAGASVPAGPGRAAGWTGNPRQAFDTARGALKPTQQELPVPETEEIRS